MQFFKKIFKISIEIISIKWYNISIKNKRGKDND